MVALFELYLNPFLVFIFVLTRLSGVVMTVPVLGARGAPMQVRALLALGMSLIVTPLHAQTPIDNPGNIVNMLVLLAREAAIGTAIGLAILILFAGAQVAGQILSQLSGMTIAEAFDPTFDSNVSAFTQLLDWTAMGIFVCVGGHRQVLGALLDSFQAFPPGHGGFAANTVDALVEITTMSFATGIRAAAPVMVALLLSVLVTGLISRTLPQLNVMAVGFNINAFVLLGTFCATLGAAAWVFQEQVDSTIDVITKIFVRT